MNSQTNSTAACLLYFILTVKGTETERLPVSQAYNRSSHKSLDLQGIPSMCSESEEQTIAGPADPHTAAESSATRHILPECRWADQVQSTVALLI